MHKISIQYQSVLGSEKKIRLIKNIFRSGTISDKEMLLMRVNYYLFLNFFVLLLLKTKTMLMRRVKNKMSYLLMR